MLTRFCPYLCSNHTESRIAHRASRQLATLLIFIFCAGVSSLLEAQVTSSIQGTVSDQQGQPIVGAEVRVQADTTGVETKSNTDSDGNFGVVGLQPGVYTVSAAHDGFTTKVYARLDLTVNRQVRLDIMLTVGSMQQTITVAAIPPLLEIGNSSTGSTILPWQMESMPLNGRNYLDLLQLVPGVSINRTVPGGDDNSAPILGERVNNAYVLIDGMPNRDEVNGGPSEEFNQDTILEFQVLTSGYKAEFGHGSGGIVNVLTKGGTNDWHGTASLFHRNYVFDSTDVAGASVPFLLRWDSNVTLSGPVLKDRWFFFGSLERIREGRESNFQFPSDFPPSLRLQEEQINRNGATYETRGFAKLDERLRHHQMTQEVNLTNTQLTDQGDQPSLRSNFGMRRLMLGICDTALLGNQSNPYVLSAYYQYRGEPFDHRPAHLEQGLPNIFVNLFTQLTTDAVFGDIAQESVGPGFTPLVLHQKYHSTGINLAKHAGRHDVKFGWDFQRTGVDGTEASNFSGILFATESDFKKFGLMNSGVNVSWAQSGIAPDKNHIRLRNVYDGLFFQDDWKIRKDFALNLGLRWDYDSEFPNRANISPRLGFSWSPNPKTVLSGSWGVFYDHFRMGVARDIPTFGGADIRVLQDISFPRLFYGDPVAFAVLPYGGLCLSPDKTDAYIAANGIRCTDAPGQPLQGVDHLNKVVDPGHAPLPSDTIVTEATVAALTGMTPQEYVDAASAAVAKPQGFFYWNRSGYLSIGFLSAPSIRAPITVDQKFRTPYTSGFHASVQREVRDNLVAYADFFHREIRNILGVRLANLAFEARLGDIGAKLPGTGDQLINSYGPWSSGRYDALIAGFRKSMSRRFTLEANYTYAHAMDNLLNSSLNSDVQTGSGVRLMGGNGPTDSFVGVPPIVSDPNTGQTNANGPFIASNGNPVPPAGKFYYGPNLDRGPSDLAVAHTFLMHGLVQLPKQFEFSAIFRAQSGFRYSRGFATSLTDLDGDGLPDGADLTAGRNHFTAPSYVNMDLRAAKWFRLGDRAKLETLIEFFNLLNRANPSQIQNGSSVAPVPFGTITQVLPGREGQVGIKIEF